MSSALPARIPASAFNRPSWRTTLPSTAPPPPIASKPVEDFYAPRYQSPMNVSISHLREAINNLDSKMAFLLNQKHELESHLEQAVRLQSPVLRLPSELLSTIFVIGVLEMGEDSVMLSTLMLVCRYWADVALETPALWAQISVSPHHSLERARRKLARSKTCPIDISIKYGPRTDHLCNVTQQVTRAMELFRPALWRTRTFHLVVPNRPQAHAALSQCQENAPLLTTLSIEVCHAIQQEDHTTIPLPLFNGHTPKLRSCYLTSFNFGWDLTFLSKLTALKLDGYFNSYSPSATTLVNILRQCPELEELTLRNLTDGESGPCVKPLERPDVPATATRLFHLPKLTKACFHYVSTTLTQHIFNQVTFPNLESLQLCYLQNVSTHIQALHTQALVRLPLRHLRIESSHLDEARLINLLKRLPSLTSLELVDIEDVSSYFMECLSMSQPWMCPRLETLSIDGCTSIEWEDLRNFVESRLPANSQAYSKNAASLPPGATMISSASAAAAAHARSKSQPAPSSIHTLRPISSASSNASNNAYLRSQYQVASQPARLKMVDVRRCNLISKEMAQWLRMYVGDVKSS